jgi:hypothetical protein
VAPRALSVLGLALLGCNEVSGLGPAICDRSWEKNPPVEYVEGVAEDGVYQSSPWDGELLWYPGGARYRLVHHLPEAPRLVQGWVGFVEGGLAGAAGAPVVDAASGALAPAAGDQFELLAVDEEAVVVHNGSCSDYWLLVTAAISAP